MLEIELDSTWMCPDIDSFMLAGDPYYSDGINFNYIINYCATLYPENSTCASMSDSESAVSNLRV